MEVSEAVLEEIKTEKQTEKVYKKTFPSVAAFVSHMGGSFEDARDIFHDALVIYFEAKSQKNVELLASEEAYILGIAKHLWIRKYNTPKVNISLNGIENKIYVPDDYFPTTDNKRLLIFLESAGKKCMDLLRNFYYEQLPFKQLANKLGYSSEHSATVQKYKCLEKIRETIKEKSLTYEDFVE
jgi:DNA-directed RNA polymerase specialized sigma24 family protein